MSVNCGNHQKYEGVAHRIFPAVVMVLLTLAPAVGSQEYGFSYLRMDVNGHTISNFVPNEKYSRGWLQIMGQPVLKADRNKTVKADDDGWAALSTVLRSRRSGPGTLRFDAGDSGGMEPLFDAIKQKSVIPQAELDLYAEDTNKFVGRFRIKKIRILSLEDMPASACGAYIITLSFQSIARE